MIVDAVEELQAWADSLVAAARAGGDGWPHPHTDLPHVRLTVGQFWRALEDGLRAAGHPWSIAVSGLPPIDESDEGVRVMNNGSLLHDAAHAAFGDFH